VDDNLEDDEKPDSELVDIVIKRNMLSQTHRGLKNCRTFKTNIKFAVC